MQCFLPSAYCPWTLMLWKQRPKPGHFLVTNISRRAKLFLCVCCREGSVRGEREVWRGGGFEVWKGEGAKVRASKTRGNSKKSIPAQVLFLLGLQWQPHFFILRLLTDTAALNGCMGWGAHKCTKKHQRFIRATKQRTKDPHLLKLPSPLSSLWLYLWSRRLLRPPNTSPCEFGVNWQHSCRETPTGIHVPSALLPRPWYKNRWVKASSVYCVIRDASLSWGFSLSYSLLCKDLMISGGAGLLTTKINMFLTMDISTEDSWGIGKCPWIRKRNK